MELLELVETYNAEAATMAALYAKEGRSARGMRAQVDYTRKVAATVNLIADVKSGKRSGRALQEAMTTSDFPLLFGDVLDRQILAAYAEAQGIHRMICRIAQVPDFRQVSRFAMNGAESVLPVVAQQAEYPEAARSETRYQYSVQKFGRRLPISWEAIINDDLGALTDTPASLGRAARRSEAKFAAGLYVNASGPHSSLYTGANTVTSNPALSIAGLQTAMTILGNMRDADNEPIVIDMAYLVVPPALEVTARNILNATEITLFEAGGTTNQNLTATNWMSNRVQLLVDPYIPVIATSNGHTSWFMFASPSTGRPALEMGFLRGHEGPEVFVQLPNAQRVGGGDVSAFEGNFENDSVNYKVRHVFGGGRLDPKGTVASNGTNS